MRELVFNEDPKVALELTRVIAEYEGFEENLSKCLDVLQSLLDKINLTDYDLNSREGLDQIQYLLQGLTIQLNIALVESCESIHTDNSKMTFDKNVNKCNEIIETIKSLLEYEEIDKHQEKILHSKLGYATLCVARITTARYVTDDASCDQESIDGYYQAALEEIKKGDDPCLEVSGNMYYIRYLSCSRENCMPPVKSILYKYCESILPLLKCPLIDSIAATRLMIYTLSTLIDPSEAKTDIKFQI